MAYCKICGDHIPSDECGKAKRFWSPDDGWIIGYLCDYCAPEAKRKPKPDDYAYERRGDYVTDVDGAIDALYG